MTQKGNETWPDEEQRIGRKRRRKRAILGLLVALTAAGGALFGLPPEVESVVQAVLLGL